MFIKCIFIVLTFFKYFILDVYVRIHFSCRFTDDNDYRLGCPWAPKWICNTEQVKMQDCNSKDCFWGSWSGTTHRRQPATLVWKVQRARNLIATISISLENGKTLSKFAETPAQPTIKQKADRGNMNVNNMWRQQQQQQHR